MKKNKVKHSDNRGLPGAINRGYRRFWRRRGIDPELAWKLQERMNARLPWDNEFDLDEDE